MLKVQQIGWLVVVGQLIPISFPVAAVMFCTFHQFKVK